MFLNRPFSIAFSTAILAALMGCGGNKQPETTAKPSANSSPSDYSAKMNNPNTSEYEKEQIRKAQGNSSNPPAFGNPAPTGGQ